MERSFTHSLYPMYYTLSEGCGMTVKIIKAVGILALVTGIGFVFSEFGLSNLNVIMAFFIGIVFIAIYTNFTVSAGSSVMSVLLFNFFFTDPKFTFSVYDKEYLFVFAFMFTVAIITSVLTSKIKNQATVAEKQEARTSALYRMGRTLLKTSDDAEAEAAALEAINAAIPGTTRIVKREESGAASNSANEAILIPLNGITENYGYLEYKNMGNRATVKSDDVSLLEAFAAQLSLAFDRNRTAREHEKAQIHAETERNRTMILRSISHDFRTPLATIAGASSALLESPLEKETREQLLSDIYEESTWLADVVENILSMSKLESGNGIVEKKPEVLDDILYSAVQRIMKRLGNRSIKVRCPDDLILVPMDGILIEQALINILDNAIRYTPEGTSIQVSVEQKSNERIIEFMVQDDGPGFPFDPKVANFDLFRIAEADRSRKKHGARLGLKICGAIIAAHGGTLVVENGVGKGAKVTFTLPAGDGTL